MEFFFDGSALYVLSFHFTCISSTSARFSSLMDQRFIADLKQRCTSMPNHQHIPL
jgi:hypothetical protein